MAFNPIILFILYLGPGAVTDPRVPSHCKHIARMLGNGITNLYHLAKLRNTRDCRKLVDRYPLLSTHCT